jgi:hypothetical protein
MGEAPCSIQGDISFSAIVWDPTGSTGGHVLHLGQGESVCQLPPFPDNKGGNLWFTHNMHATFNETIDD